VHDMLQMLLIIYIVVSLNTSFSDNWVGSRPAKNSHQKTPKILPGAPERDKVGSPLMPNLQYDVIISYFQHYKTLKTIILFIGLQGAPIKSSHNIFMITRMHQFASIGENAKLYSL